ncbi:MAG: energy transducer TonB, partial [Saprospiraceae bacterium]|nr:energy transducer TonB [Saprospiraceae bacterium]
NFIVDENGKVQSPYLLMDIGNGCGEAAIAVVKAMPAWSPGLQNDQPVKVKLNLPVHFSLRKAESEASDRFTITWGEIVGDTISVQQLKNNLPFGIYVRGPEGDSHYIDELTFSVEKGKRVSSASSRGNINEALVAIVEKTKAGGLFTITASVQENGQFVRAKRTFFITE